MVEMMTMLIACRWICRLLFASNYLFFCVAGSAPRLLPRFGGYSAIDKNNNTCSKCTTLSIRPSAPCFIPSKPKSAVAFIINAMADVLFIVYLHRGSLEVRLNMRRRWHFTLTSTQLTRSENLRPTFVHFISFFFLFLWHCRRRYDKRT